MPRYRLLAIDIDGTLVNSRDEVTPATRDALRRAVDAGIHVVLATGRRYSRALPLVAPLGLDLPLITASGALVKHPLDHSTIYCAEFERDRLLRMLSIIDQAGYEAVLYADTFALGHDMYCRRVEVEQPELAEFFAMNPVGRHIWPSIMTDPPPGVFSGFTMGPRDEMEALASTLETRMPGELYIHVIRSPRYQGYMCELASHGVTKWSSVERLAREWGIDDAEICAVGDDVNDIPMLLGAGLGVAMGNAADEVKAAADRIAPTNNQDGLAEVIEWLLDS
jgi:5-amino-6-(5-phospho-D-ribitylamino)uracil phosphatase